MTSFNHATSQITTWMMLEILKNLHLMKSGCTFGVNTSQSLIHIRMFFFLMTKLCMNPPLNLTAYAMP